MKQFEEISPSEDMVRRAALLDDGEILWVKKATCTVIMKTTGCIDDELYVWSSCKWRLTSSRLYSI